PTWRRQMGGNDGRPYGGAPTCTNEANRCRYGASRGMSDRATTRVALTQCARTKPLAAPTPLGARIKRAGPEPHLLSAEEGAPTRRQAGAVARVDAIEQTQVGRPIRRAAAGIVLLVLRRGLLADLRRDFQERAAGRFHLELDVRGFHQILHQHERF